MARFPGSNYFVRALWLCLLIVPHAVCMRSHKTEDLTAVQTAEEAATSSESEKLLGVLTKGTKAFDEIVSLLTQDPLDMKYLSKHLHENLWGILVFLEGDRENAPEDMEKAWQVWEEVFEKAGDISAGLMKFREEGDTDALIESVTDAMEVALGSVANLFPKETKYFSAIVDVVSGLGECWDVLGEGDTGGAVTTLWRAVRTAVDEVVPAEFAQERIYQLVTGSIDNVLSDVSRHVLEYKRMILTSKVCYKRKTYRQKVRPSICKEGFDWDQGTLCWPGPKKGGHCLETCGHAGLCDSYCGNERACCRRGFEKDPAECHGTTGYVDYHFTTGGSHEYHQCVAAGPNVALRVSGSGMEKLNGLYVKNGIHSGKQRYTKAGATKTVIEWSASRKVWRFFVDETWFGHGRKTLYLSKSGTAVAPADGWEVVKGILPVPEINPYTPPEPLEQGSLAEVEDLPHDPQNSLERGSLLEANASSSWFTSAKFGTHEAQCDTTSTFPEKSGSWCLSACPAGFRQNGDRCKQECTSNKFVVDASSIPGMCGVSQGEIILAMTEMAGMVLKTTLTASVLINSMVTKGISVDKLSHTVNVFVDMGKPFARPRCPLLESVE